MVFPEPRGIPAKLISRGLIIEVFVHDINRLETRTRVVFRRMFQKVGQQRDIPQKDWRAYHYSDETSDDSDNGCCRHGGESPNVGENSKNRRRELQLQTTRKISDQ